MMDYVSDRRGEIGMIPVLASGAEVTEMRSILERGQTSNLRTHLLIVPISLQQAGPEWTMVSQGGREPASVFRGGRKP